MRSASSTRNSTFSSRAPRPRRARRLDHPRREVGGDQPAVVADAARRRGSRCRRFPAASSSIVVAGLGSSRSTSRSPTGAGRRHEEVALALPVGGSGPRSRSERSAVLVEIRHGPESYAGPKSRSAGQPSCADAHVVGLDRLLASATSSAAGPPPRSRGEPWPRRRRTRGTAAPGRVGRELNSGWNCEATKNGWSGSSTISTRRSSGEVPPHDQALVLEPAAQHVVDLVAVAVALVDHGLAEDLARPGALVELHRVGAEAHRPAHVGDLLLLGQQVDHRDTASRGRTRSSWRRPCRRRGGRTRRRRSASRGRCRGRGSRRSRAIRAASILPSIPRSPKPPGIRIPSAQPAISLGVEVLGVDQLDLDVGAVVVAAVV